MDFNIPNKLELAEIFTPGDIFLAPRAVAEQIPNAAISPCIIVCPTEQGMKSVKHIVKVEIAGAPVTKWAIKASTIFNQLTVGEGWVFSLGEDTTRNVAVGATSNILKHRKVRTHRNAVVIIDLVTGEVFMGYYLQRGEPVDKSKRVLWDRRPSRRGNASNTIT